MNLESGAWFADIWKQYYSFFSVLQFGIYGHLASYLFGPLDSVYRTSFIISTVTLKFWDFFWVLDVLKSIRSQPL